jgi:radical SAM protein with 4Fe4S-binding SPASM domain
MWEELNNAVSVAESLRKGRLANLGKLYAGYKASLAVRRPLQLGMPASISLEPTTSCNLHCPECPSGLRAFTRPQGNLKLPMIAGLLDELSPFTHYLNLYFQGEPYIHKQIFDLIRAGRERGMYVSTSTNAHFLSEKNAIETVKSGLSRLIISIDGTTQETYEQYRIGGSLNKVLEGTRNLIEAKKELGRGPYTVFQFLVVRPNEHQVEDARRLAKEMGVDKIVFKTAQVYDYEEGSDLIPLNEEYSRYAQGTDGKFAIKNKLLNQCWKSWHSAVVTWDGRVVPCCFDKDATHQMGKLSESSFRDIWFGDGYKAFRQSIIKSRQEIDICRNCTEGTKVFA